MLFQKLTLKKSQLCCELGRGSILLEVALESYARLQRRAAMTYVIAKGCGDFFENEEFQFKILKFQFIANNRFT